MKHFFGPPIVFSHWPRGILKWPFCLGWWQLYPTLHIFTTLVVPTCDISMWLTISLQVLQIYQIGASGTAFLWWLPTMQVSCKTVDITDLKNQGNTWNNRWSINTTIRGSFNFLELKIPSPNLLTTERQGEQWESFYQITNKIY